MSQFKPDGKPVSFVPDIWSDAMLSQLQRSSQFADLLATLPRPRLTRRERLARWWDNRRPRVHLGACRHDDCGDY